MTVTATAKRRRRQARMVNGRKVKNLELKRVQVAKRKGG